MKKRMKHSAVNYSRVKSLKVILNFILFSAVWIIFSGLILDKIHLAGSVRNLIEILKGLVYVLVTSIFLYPIIKKEIFTSRNAIEKLSVSKENFSRLFENASLAIFQSTLEGKIMVVNSAFARMFGYSSPEEVKKIVRNISKDIYTDTRRHQEIIKTKLENPEQINFEVEYKKKDGDIFFGDLHLNLITDDNHNILYIEGFIEDITNKRLAEEKLKIFAQAIKSVSECISITDEKNIILFVNDSFLKTYGYKENELIGKHVSILHPNFVPEDKEKSILDETNNGGWKGELVNIKKDGTVFPIHLSTSTIKDDWGNTLALIGVATDITEVKRTREELISAKNEAEKANRIKTEFLAQMSHEIRSPLNISLNYTSMIKEELGNNISSSLKEYFSVIDIAGRRLIRTIDLILNMSEMQLGIYSADFEEIDLVNDVFPNLNHEFAGLCISKGLEYIFIDNGINKKIICDRYSVSQIFVNLLDNAFKYTHKGKIEVVISKNEESQLQVSISDTGIGMSKDFIENLFEPFTQEEHGYSRKYEGNGLGLSLVKKYCELNNADIAVISEKDSGTKFIVTFRKS